MSLPREFILSKDLLFDTDVMNNVFKDNNKEQQFWISLDSLNTYRSDSYWHISTILLTFEYLGFKPKDLNPFYADPKLTEQVRIKFETTTNDNIAEVAESIMKLLTDWFKQAPLFSVSSLFSKLSEEVKRKSPRVGKVYQSLIGDNLLKADFEKGVYPRLALHSLLKFDYRKTSLPVEITSKLDMFFLSTSRNMFIEGFKGYAFTKFADRTLVLADESGKAKSAYRELGEEVDLEIVHFVCVGSEQRGKRNSVAVFTTESIDKWRNRISRYLAYLSYILEDANFSIYPGVIYQVDSLTGKIIERLNVYEDFGQDLRDIKLKIVQDELFI